jgi:acylphosphatase
MKRVHAYYSGDVHGVGFRFTAVDLARRYGVKGWVRNCADGRVELVAEAKEAALQSFLSQIRSSMAHYINDEDTSFLGPTNEYSGFEIRY